MSDKPRILVVGDCNLDVYRIGTAERISPEAPVPVVRHLRTEIRPGGAAAVAWIAEGLGATVQLVSNFGQDVPGSSHTHDRRLVSFLERAGVHPQGTIDGSPTVKTRICAESNGHGLHQVCRDDDDHRTTETKEIADVWIPAAFDEFKPAIVLIADYGRGVCSPFVLAAVIRRANFAGVPVLVDPAFGRDPREYKGADLIKFNRAESVSIAATAEPTDVFPYTIRTLDADGAEIWRQGDHHRAPSVARRVVDVTGAGDAMLAAMGVWWTRQTGEIDPRRLLDVAQRAAAAEIAEFGVVQIGPEVLDEPATATEFNPPIAAAHTLPWRLDWLKTERFTHKRDKGSDPVVVLLNGCFDVLHRAHLELFYKARTLGQITVVAINSDASVRRLKGEGRPINNHNDRAYMLNALETVDHVIVFDEDTPADVIKAVRPDVLLRGDEVGRIVGQDFVESYGGRAVLEPKRHGYSTTAAIGRARK